MAGSYLISKVGGVVEFLNTHFAQNSRPADIILEFYLQVRYLQAHLMGHVFALFVFNCNLFQISKVGWA